MVKYWSTQKLTAMLGATLFLEFFTFTPSVSSPPKPFHNFPCCHLLEPGPAESLGCVCCPILVFLLALLVGNQCAFLYEKHRKMVETGHRSFMVESWWMQNRLSQEFGCFWFLMPIFALF